MIDTIALFEDKLKTLEEFYRLLPEPRSRRLTIPAIFRRAEDENFISDYLAYILDPEKNGIGNAPLNALLDLLGELPVEPGTQVLIDREYTFENGNRIDFLIQINEGMILGIENKITANEAPLQTIGYQRSIATEFPDLHHCLVFLTPNGTTASSEAFKSLSYKDLYHCWRCIPFSPLPDIHKSVIWEDFLAHLEEYIIMGNRPLDLSEKTKLYLKYRNIVDDLTQAVQQDAQTRLDHALGLLRTLYVNWTEYGRSGDISHWYVKQNWYLDNKTYAFANYYFKARTFIDSNTIPFGVGIYPYKDVAIPFVEFFKSNYSEAVLSYCTQYQMEAFPKKQAYNFWIAWKEYAFNTFEPAEITAIFTQSRKELEALETIIDDAMSAYLAQQKV